MCFEEVLPIIYPFCAVERFSRADSNILRISPALPAPREVSAQELTEERRRTLRVCFAKDGGLSFGSDNLCVHTTPNQNFDFARHRFRRVTDQEDRR
jgi:hypothetical protein